MLNEFDILIESCVVVVVVFSAYETLSDESRRREFDQSGGAIFTQENQSKDRQSDHQSFTFDFNDIIKDFGIFSQNRHSHQDRDVHEHSRSHNRPGRHFEGGFGADVLDDIENLERMFTFDGHTKQTQKRFHGQSKRHCRTVTQRRGNMVTTHIDCTVL